MVGLRFLEKIEDEGRERMNQRQSKKKKYTGREDRHTYVVKVLKDHAGKDRECVGR